MSPAGKAKQLRWARKGSSFFIPAENRPKRWRDEPLNAAAALAGVTCMIVAVDDSFIVPLPTTSKVTGFFRADKNASIAADARDDVARKLADTLSGWSAVAVGTSGRPGLARPRA